MVNTLDLRPTHRTLLIALAASAVFAGAAATGWWTPQWSKHRNATLTWLLPRLVLIVFAVSAIAATTVYRPSLPSCPDSYASGTDSGIRGGELLYASIRGDTFVCTYRDLSGSL